MQMLFSLDTIARSDMYLVNDQVLCDCKEPITWIDCDIHGDLEPYAAKCKSCGFIDRDCEAS